MSDNRKKSSKNTELIEKFIIFIVVFLSIVGLILLCANKIQQLKNGETAKVKVETETVEEEKPIAATTAKEAQADVLDYYYTEQGTVFIEDEEYVPKSSITNLLFIGLDDEVPPNADFLMLLSFNNETGTCNVIEINAYMDVLGTTDYSNAMGMSIAESAKLGIPNLLQQCEHIFYGEIFDYYIAMNMKDTAELLMNLGIEPGELIVHTAQSNKGFNRTSYGRLFINSFIKYINESKFTMDFLSDTWGFIDEHSQNNGTLESMGQIFVSLKTYEVQKSWETPAIEYLNEFNLYKPENKPLVIETFYNKVR